MDSRDPLSGEQRDLVAFAIEVAAAARRETLPRWAAPGRIDNKSKDGFDPVTEADRAAERAMREMIGERFPTHGISGEEYGDMPGSGARRWSLDPVDGTRAFICRLPSWVTLIALVEGDRPILGVIDAPALDELYVGVAGHGTMRAAGAEAPIAVSACQNLAEARVSTTDPDLFDGAEAQGWAHIRSRARTIRYGLDGYAYARLAAGSIDLVVESRLKPHDYLALIPVVRAAGGTIGDWEGRSGADADFGPGRVVAAATPALYAEAVAGLA